MVTNLLNARREFNVVLERAATSIGPQSGPMLLEIKSKMLNTENAALDSLSTQGRSRMFRQCSNR
jgi:hypothetical protein